MERWELLDWLEKEVLEAYLELQDLLVLWGLRVSLDQLDSREELDK